MPDARYQMSGTVPDLMWTVVYAETVTPAPADLSRAGSTGEDMTAVHVIDIAHLRDDLLRGMPHAQMD